MAPLRSGRATNRANRGQVEHDIMEGLPVRQWRKMPAVINLIPLRDANIAKGVDEGRWTELPMPRGSELYPPHSQALLRQARMLKMSRPNLDDEGDGQDEDAEGDPDDAYVARKWSHVPREQEQPEQEYLAERRNGMPPLYGSIPSAGGGMRKTKVKKIDADGTAHFLDVLLPETATIDGEVVDLVAVPTEAPAPGTVVPGVGVANEEGVVVAAVAQVQSSPARRKPPPPKRKNKGPGRGRKKKVMLEVPNATDDVAEPGNVGGTGPDGTQTGLGIMTEPTKRIASNGNGPDYVQDGEEGSENDDDDGEGEDGEEGDREEGELSPTPEDGKSAGPSPSKSPAMPPTKPSATKTVAGTAPPPATEADGTALADVSLTVEQSSSAPNAQDVVTPLSAEVHDTTVRAVKMDIDIVEGQVPVTDKYRSDGDAGPTLQAEAKPPAAISDQASKHSQDPGALVIDPVTGTKSQSETLVGLEVDAEVAVVPESGLASEGTEVQTEAAEDARAAATISAQGNKEDRLGPEPAEVETGPATLLKESSVGHIEKSFGDGGPDLLGSLEKHLEKASSS